MSELLETLTFGDLLTLAGMVAAGGAFWARSSNCDRRLEVVEQRLLHDSESQWSRLQDLGDRISRLEGRG